MKKPFLIAILLLSFADILYSQQIPLYSQYYFNPFVYNPAMTGSGDKANAFLINRSQWTDIPGAPVTRALTLDGPIKAKKVGLGIGLFNDATGFIEKMGVYASYSYRVAFSDAHNLLFGLSLGALDSRIDFSKVVVRDTKDQFLLNQDQRKTTVDANFGLMYLWKSLEFGIAIPQIIGNSLEYTNLNNDSRTFYDLSRHYQASVKYTFDINAEKNISAYPLILMRYTPGAPIQYDINGVFNWQNIGWLAVSYRSDYAVGLNARLKIHKSISVGYAYDYIISSIGTYAGTSHEFMLGYTFDVSGVKKSKDITGKQPEDITNRINELNISLPHLIFNDSINRTKLKLLIEKERTKGKKTENIVQSHSNSYFINDKGYRAEEGYYLIIASFDADEEGGDRIIDEYLKKGYGLVFDEKTKKYHIYKPQTFEKALDELDKARNSEFPTSWILILE